ncbi:MAG: hypothetical protein IAF94_01150 [Pirellulaceae bacterium]|nr:hypothetical protein [Pirellulaceae bacterium]
MPHVHRFARLIVSLAILVPCLFLANRAAAEDKKPDTATAPITQGQKMCTCGHSFHYFMPAILKELAKAGEINGHEQVGESYIGGSRIIQHWDVPAEKNKVRDLLKAGKVDVLTLAPIHLPDDGIENFVKLATENNPNVRITIQENWLPFDIYDVTFKLRPAKVDHNAMSGEQLWKLHEPYFTGLDEHVRALNKKVGREAVYVAPVGQAVIGLREKVIAGQAPGIKTQEDLFTDPLGHVKVPAMVLNAYCHYAVIYRKSPVGLPVPAILKTAKLGDDEEKLNTLLQELAWEAATKHPLSGVKAEAKP